MMPDEELVARAQLGDREAFGLLFSRYEPLVKKFIGRWNRAMDGDDVRGIASEGFVKAVHTYDETRGVWFRGHVKRTVHGTIRDVWRAGTAEKRAADTVPYNAAFAGGQEGELTLEDVIPDERSWEEFDRVTDWDCLQEVVDRFVVSATERELEVFYLKIMRGLDNPGVAEFFHTGTSYVANVDQKMKKKLRQYALDSGLLVELPKSSKGQHMKKKELVV